MNKYKVFLSFVLVLVAVGAVYFYMTTRAIPYQVLSPDNYPDGTQISLYKELPPGFPSGIILEGRELNYAGTITSKDLKKRITVSYVSPKTLSELATMYENNFTSKGWAIGTKSVTKTAAVFQVTKSEKVLILTIAPLNKEEMLLTFQYE